VNAAVAIAAASAFLGRPLRDDEVRSGFAAVRMPGRYEVVRLRPTVVLDGAHNPDAAAALAATVSAAPAVADGAAAPRPGRRIVVLGILAGRDPGAMLDALAPAEFTDVVACTPPTGRARPADEVAAAAAQRGYRTSSFPSVGDALADVLENAGPDDLVVVTGSIYLVAEAREVLQVG
jgi:dihydrofolate synthase/folylpolyglutamate synthase